jgi:hypothetical protein
VFSLNQTTYYTENTTISWVGKFTIGVSKLWAGIEINSTRHDININIMIIFMYLIVYGVFSDAGRSPDYTALNGRFTNE